MPGLKQENATAGIKKVARERLLTHALKQPGNIANAWIQDGKTDCLSRD